MSVNESVSEKGESKKNPHPPKILRFRKSERMVHWAQDHYARWYQENFEGSPSPVEEPANIIRFIREDYPLANSDTSPALQHIEAVQEGGEK